MDASSAAITTTGVNGWRFVAVNANDGLEFAFLGSHTFVANLATFVINAGRDDGTEAHANGQEGKYANLLSIPISFSLLLV